MKEIDRPMLDGHVEMDETFIGGKRRNSDRQQLYAGKDKEIVIGIRQRGGALRLFHVQDVKAGTLAKYIRENISKDVESIPDR